jgi:hypothetical protein
MGKLFWFVMAVGVAGAVYWYFRRSSMDQMSDYADDARQRARDVFDAGRRFADDAKAAASDVASRASDEATRASDAIRA